LGCRHRFWMNVGPEIVCIEFACYVTTSASY
jgi:hypothetical protein